MHINISTSSRAFRWRPGCWLRISGSDAFTFLQGQFTNDLRELERQPAVYGLWLNLKGKVLADSFVLRAPGPDAFWVGSYFSTAAAIRERLEGFVIADDVGIEDLTAGWAGVSVVGPEAGILRDERPQAGVIFPGRRGVGGAVEWVFPLEAAGTVEARLKGAEAVPATEVERWRIAARIPAVPADLGPADLPNEGGLETSAISYTKGCYLGQEVMARLKSMGRVRRRLLPVRGEGGSIPELPAKLFGPVRQVGELRSAVRGAEEGYLGLAMLSLPNLTPAMPLALAPEAAPTLRLLEES
jgi:folate-binding protein YgfZ